MAENVLEVEHLSVTLGRTNVLRDLSFTVIEGSALAVIGPNGSGKTVLFRALIGAVPHQGTIRWASTARLGYVPQKLDIERDLPITGRDFLAAKASISGGTPQDIQRAFALVGLDTGMASQPIGTLSGGQFQRLLLGFALLAHLTVLLFDEPTAGVDEPGEEHLYEVIDRLRREERMTLLLISHELSVVFRHATRVLCLARDRACFGSPREILTPEMITEVYGRPVKYHLHE